MSLRVKYKREYQITEVNTLEETKFCLSGKKLGKDALFWLRPSKRRSATRNIWLHWQKIILYSTLWMLRQKMQIREGGKLSLNNRPPLVMVCLFSDAKTREHSSSASPFCGSCVPPNGVLGGISLSFMLCLYWSLS